MKSLSLLLCATVAAAGCTRSRAQTTVTEPTVNQATVAEVPAPSASPSMAQLPDRYQEIPARGLFENYVLSTIGELSVEREKATSKFVRREVGSEANWRTSVRKRFEWHDSVDALILKAWEDYKPKHTTADHPADSEVFAGRFVDEAFMRQPPAAGESRIISVEIAKAARQMANVPTPTVSVLPSLYAPSARDAGPSVASASAHASPPGTGH